MDQQLLQRTRYLLQTRFRRIRNAKLGHFELVCQQVFDWLENHPILSSVTQHLDNVPGDHQHEIQLILNSDRVGSARYFVLIAGKDRKQPEEPDFKGYTPKTFEEHASACLQILRAAIQKPNLDFYCLLAVYLTNEEYSARRQNVSDSL